MLEVTIASTDRQLTTVAAVKAAMRTTSTADDDLLDSLVTRASAWAESYVGYPLAAQKYLELVPGYGSRRLMLSRTPVVAVPGLFRGTDSGDYLQVNTSEFSIDRGAGFVERGGGWSWSAPVFGDLSMSPAAGQEAPEWRVEYVAGFSRDGLSTGSALWSTEGGTTSTERTLPADIEAAVIAKVAAWADGSEDVLERQVGDLKIRYGSFGTPNDPITKDRAQILLDPWRRLA